MNLSIFGRVLRLDFANNIMSIGEYASPITVTHKGMDLTIIVDRCSMEIFADEGKIYFTCLDKNTVCDFNIPYITIETNNEILLENIEINLLDTIWRK